MVFCYIAYCCLNLIYSIFILGATYNSFINMSKETEEHSESDGLEDSNKKEVGEVEDND